MTLPRMKPMGGPVLTEGTTSIATSPVPAVAVVTCRGILGKVMAAAGGTTTGTITVSASLNGGADLANGALQIPAGSNARNGGAVDLLVWVNEGDVLTFTPSGGTGANIPGVFGAVIRPH